MPRKPRDALRTKLDRLAEQIADQALTGLDAPAEDTGTLSLRDKVNVLKVAGAYYGISRKTGGSDKKEPNAWEGYTSRILGNGQDHDAEEDRA